MDKNTDMFVVSIYGVIASLINDIKVGDVLFINKPVQTALTSLKFLRAKFSTLP